MTVSSVPGGAPADGQASPRVTVITIFLDPGEYFEAAIASVLTQSYDQLEYLLVDDGSSDGSSEVARRTAAAHPGRVRYLEHPGHLNRGMSASRNLGLRHARGEFVSFLDADDVWFADAVERQVAHLDAHPEAAMAIGATRHWSSWSDPSVVDRDYSLGVLGLVPPTSLAERLLHQRSMPPSMNAILARREAVADIGGFENAFRTLFEDQVFFFKFFLEHTVVVHDELVDCYRQHPRSAVATAERGGDYHRGGLNRPRQTFRRFAVRHLRSGRFRRSAIHRDALWLSRWDRWPAVERHLYRLRPGLLRRVRARLLRRRRHPGS